MIEELNGDFLQWLRGFYFVAKTGSVRKAAELMHRNPSTISYQLRSLENELGVTLFVRHNKAMLITQEGETLFEWAVTTFEALRNMLASVTPSGENLRGPIEMAATLPIVSLAVNSIAKFIAANPQVKLNIRRRLSGDVRRDVSEAEVDFGILPVIKRPVNEALDVIARARPFLVYHKDLEGAIPAIPDLADLEKLPIVMFDSQLPQEDLGNYAKLAGTGDFIEKNAVIRANNYHIILRLVSEKMGAAIMDELCFLGSKFGGEWSRLRHVALDHIFPNRLYGILTRKNKYLSPQSLGLIATLKEHFLSLPQLRETWSPPKK